ncbi:MAG: RecX family transcriptional regulator [Bacteroidales bacterium]|nr:RecX family transcriptional regulator [Bacteroidales bacterium]
MVPPLDFLLDKARNYCAYQERCIFDVKNKLLEWHAAVDTVEEIIKTLEDENYLDEERYARVFAVGKLRQNKWGRNKIIHALLQKQVPDLTIQIGLQALDDEEYLHVLKTVLSSKKVQAKSNYNRQQKLVRYAFQKGFQPELVWKVLREEI